MATECFFLEPTGEAYRSLRRYCSPPAGGHDCATGYHNAETPIEDGEYRTSARYPGCVELAGPGDAAWPRDDPRWPPACACGYRFRAEDHWQVFGRRVYRRADTGERTTLEAAPAGAMWYADWLCLEPLDGAAGWTGPDGHHLVVKTPGGEWNVDSAASNCSMPDDFAQRRHHCWTRTGAPPRVTVDKAHGPTCAAGAGSIQCGAYHGFLIDGRLVP